MTEIRLGEIHLVMIWWTEWRERRQAERSQSIELTTQVPL